MRFTIKVVISGRNLLDFSMCVCVENMLLVSVQEQRSTIVLTALIQPQLTRLAFWLTTLYVTQGMCMGSVIHDLVCEIHLQISVSDV